MTESEQKIGAGFKLTIPDQDRGIVFDPHIPYPNVIQFNELATSVLEGHRAEMRLENRDDYKDRKIGLRDLPDFPWYEIIDQERDELWGIFIQKGVDLQELLPQLREKYGDGTVILE